MREVVEDQHEVGLDERRERHAHRVLRGSRDGRLERRDRVVAERADGAAREARHPLDRHDPALGDEGSQRGERVGGGGARDRQVRCVALDRDRARGGPRDAVADLQQPPRTHAEEAVPAEALAALDRLEQVRRRLAVVEAQEGADRCLEVGRPCRADEDRVGGGGEALGFAEAQRIGHAVGPFGGLRAREPEAPENQKRPSSFQGRKVVDLPRCHPRSAVCRAHDRQVCAGWDDRPADRRCPVSLALAPTAGSLE